jgi:hypothetical protein
MQVGAKHALARIKNSDGQIRLPKVNDTVDLYLLGSGQPFRFALPLAPAPPQPVSSTYRSPAWLGGGALIDRSNPKAPMK